MTTHEPKPPDLLVVKVGGSCLEQLEPEWWDGLMELCPPAKLAVVHGWSRMVSAVTPEGQPDFIVDKHGFRSRYTTPEVLEQIERVSAELRERIAGVLRDRGLTVEPVDGAESRLLHAEVRQNMWWVGDELVSLTNLVGPVREIDQSRLDLLLAENDTIVVTPLAVTPDHPRVNTDADRAAAAIAGGGGAERLVLVMDADAVLADGEPVRHAERADLPRLQRHAEGGMAKKLRAVEEAFERGVRQVAIGRAPVPDLLAGRAGTLIVDTEPPPPRTPPRPGNARPIGDRVIARPSRPRDGADGG
jgi:[amino group carrier protein]-L-2-aminoadipate 6-kinase